MGKSENIILSAGEGRKYHCGKMTAIFKADEAETDEKYSVSEWRIEPHSEGPGAHLHEENDEIFFVLEGNADFLLSTPTFISIGLMVLSLLFVLGALTSGMILFRSRKVKINQLVYYFLFILSVLHIIASIFLVYFEFIPLITWA